MKTKVLYSLLLLALFQFSFTESKLTVVSPHQLASHFRDGSDDDGIIPFALANYGNAPHGAHFVGGLALADPINACGRIDHFLAGEIQFDQNIIAVVRMGGCQNTVKTRNAQLAGAKMVILVQDTDDELPIAEGFGTGAGTENIHIPTIMISKEDGDQIIKFVENLPFPPVNPDDIIPLISITFPYEAKRNVVNLDFWMTSSDQASYDFLADFGSYISINIVTFKFTPHYVTWDCYMCKRTGYNGMVQATEDCLSNGRYCAPDPDREEGALRGSDTLKEDMRQICAWKQNPLVWWNYIDSYSKNCIKKQGLEECSNKYLSAMKMSDNVTQCVTDSFGAQGSDMHTTDTTLLAAEKELQLEYDITEFPVLLINHKPFNGDLNDTDEVMREVCRNLNVTVGECKKFAVASEDSFINPKKNGPGAGVILLVIFILLISGALILFFFRRVQKRSEAHEISLEANSMVSKYMAIRDLPQATRDEEGETHA